MKPFKILFTLSLLLLGFALKGAAPLYTTVNKIKYLCVFENATVVGHDYDLMGITIVPKVTVDCKDYYVDKIDSNALEYVHSPYIDIPEGIKEIGDYAFRDCDIYSLFLPNSLEKIGYCAFMDNKIDEVCFGEGIKEIEEYAFGGYVDKVSYASVESACNIILGSENMFGKHTVKINREIIFDLVVPDAVSEIKNYIFQKAKISTLKLSDSVKRIGVKSFAASELRTVDLGNGINSIDDKTFADCKSLYEVSFGNSLKKIGTESFSGCTALTQVVLPESLVEIGPWAFQKCINMTSLFIPKSVQYFGYASFSYCGSLQTVEIENGVTFIPGGCFAGCENLSSITLPETLTSIEKIAFQDCKKLRSVKLSASVVFIGEKAFENCTDLQEVSCYATNPPSCKEDAFLNSYPEYMTLRVPKGKKDMYATSKGWKDFGRIIDDLEVAGIEGITVSGNTNTIDYDLPYTVYTIDGALAGTSIELLSPGIYIVRQGPKSVKTVIK